MNLLGHEMLMDFADLDRCCLIAAASGFRDGWELCDIISMLFSFTSMMDLHWSIFRLFRMSLAILS